MARTLSADDKAFFDLVVSAGFSNPFSPERLSTDQRIAGVTQHTPREETLEKMLVQVNSRIQKLGTFKVSEFHGEDRKRLEMTVLFMLFHAFSDTFDAHIEAQAKAGTKTLRLECGAEIVLSLARYGYTDVHASRVVSLFFQIRRAFHFLSRGLVGTSASMQDVRRQAWDNIFTRDLALYERLLWNRLEDFSTFLIGETGSGKGALAHALGHSGWIEYNAAAHRFEHSFTSAFVPINLSQFAESLVESELFGHARGAFTGAVNPHDGVFKRCQSHGTIFLDEIGEVSIPIQIKLLRVLQERSFTPVGSYEELRFQGRVVAATNQAIGTLREEGKFRDDFYYRLCSDIISMPSLKERIDQDPEDLYVLIEHMVTRIVGEPDAAIIGAVSKTIDTLPKNYAWPGNVRELEQCVRQVIMRGTYRGDTLRKSGSGLLSILGEQELTANELIQAYCVAMYHRYHTYEEVGRRLGLDRRTVKKYIVESLNSQEQP